jgi:hypothetical protein
MINNDRIEMDHMGCDEWVNYKEFTTPLMMVGSVEIT